MRTRGGGAGKEGEDLDLGACRPFVCDWSSSLHSEFRMILLIVRHCFGQCLSCCCSHISYVVTNDIPPSWTSRATTSSDLLQRQSKRLGLGCEPQLTNFWLRCCIPCQLEEGDLPPVADVRVYFGGCRESTWQNV